MATNIVTGAAGTGTDTDGNKYHGGQVEPFTASIVHAAGATNTLTATITLKDRSGAAIAAVHGIEVWISRDSDGSGLTATAASGTLTASTGTIRTALTAKKHVMLTTDANGIAVLALVDSAKTQGERFIVKMPGGRLVVGAASVTADYGA
jgi:hypothetical protein